MEQVKTGFDNWAQSVDRAGVVAVEDTFYKLNDMFLVRKSGENVSGFFVRPEIIRKPAVETAWTSAEASTALPAEILSQQEGQWIFSATSDALIPLESATMLDIADLYDATVLNPRVLIGVFLGCMVTFVFCAMTMKAVGRAAF